MFYENIDFQFASFHKENRNNHAVKSSIQTFRIVLIGDENVGKSKLIEFLREKTFEQRTNNDRRSLDVFYQNRTIERRLRLKFFSVNFNDEDFPRAHCLLFVYDLAKSLSFFHLTQRFFDIVQRRKKKKFSSISLIGLKHDEKICSRVTDEQIDLFVKISRVKNYKIDFQSNIVSTLLKTLLDNYFHEILPVQLVEDCEHQRAVEKIAERTAKFRAEIK